MQAPLVGAVGQEYVHSVLTSMNPQNAVKEIQKHGAFRNKRCKPVLELLDQLGLKRCPPMPLFLPSHSTEVPGYVDQARPLVPMTCIPVLEKMT